MLLSPAAFSWCHIKMIQTLLSYFLSCFYYTSFFCLLGIHIDTGNTDTRSKNVPNLYIFFLGFLFYRKSGWKIIEARKCCSLLVFMHLSERVINNIGLLSLRSSVEKGSAATRNPWYRKIKQNTFWCKYIHTKMYPAKAKYYVTDTCGNKWTQL